MEQEVVALRDVKTFTDEQTAYMVGLAVRAYCPKYEGEVREVANDNS